MGGPWGGCSTGVPGMRAIHTCMIHYSGCDVLFVVYFAVALAPLLPSSRGSIRLFISTRDIFLLRKHDWRKLRTWRRRTWGFGSEFTPSFLLVLRLPKRRTVLRNQGKLDALEQRFRKQMERERARCQRRLREESERTCATEEKRGGGAEEKGVEAGEPLGGPHPPSTTKDGPSKDHHESRDEQRRSRAAGSEDEMSFAKRAAGSEDEWELSVTKPQFHCGVVLGGGCSGEGHAPTGSPVTGQIRAGEGRRLVCAERGG